MYGAKEVGVRNPMGKRPYILPSSIYFDTPAFQTFTLLFPFRALLFIDG